MIDKCNDSAEEDIAVNRRKTQGELDAFAVFTNSLWKIGMSLQLDSNRKGKFMFVIEE